MKCVNESGLVLRSLSELVLTGLGEVVIVSIPPSASVAGLR